VTCRCGASALSPEQIRNLAGRIGWLIALLIQEGPRRVDDIVRSTELPRAAVDDACWDLLSRGKIRCRPDSVLEWIA
jgi:hypothetical protein